MSIQVWQFPHSGTIPGIPGEWHAGQVVDVETDPVTGISTVVGTRLANAPVQPDTPEASTLEVPAPAPEQPSRSAKKAVTLE